MATLTDTDTTDCEPECNNNDEVTQHLSELQKWKHNTEENLVSYLGYAFEQEMTFLEAVYILINISVIELYALCST